MAKYNRHQSVISRQSDAESNEDNWINKLESSLQKSAVQPKNVDDSLFNQINSIMNNKSRYPSVAAAVEDMKERSGLTGYLNKLNKVSEKDSDNMKTANNEYYRRGFDMGKYDLDRNQASDIVAGLRALHKPVPYEHWMDYANGYAVGAQLSDEDKKHEFHIVKEVSKKHLKNASGDPNDNNVEKDIANPTGAQKTIMPIVIQKFPSIKQTIENYIRDTKGNIPVPAIIEKIKNIHRTDVSDPKDWDDDQLIRFVSTLNLNAKKNNPASYEVNHNLGSRTDFNSTEIDPSNTDAFFALNPAKF